MALKAQKPTGSDCNPELYNENNITTKSDSELNYLDWKRDLSILACLYQTWFA